jgi:large subunit ribosomal protein L17
MHSGSNSTKFGRARAQRQALLRSLAESLILQESIETTLPKAKAVGRYTEKLVTRAKKGQDNLHHRRLVIASLNTLEAAHKLVDDIAPQLTVRNSGYFRIEKLGTRRGDSAQLAKISFVDDLKAAKKSQKTVKPAANAKRAPAKTSASRGKSSTKTPAKPAARARTKGAK